MVSYSQLDVIMTIDVSNSQGVEYKNADGVETALGDDSSKTFPFLLTKQDEGQGRIFILNGNSLTNSDYAYPILNCMFYSMGKNVIFMLILNMIQMMMISLFQEEKKVFN